MIQDMMMATKEGGLYTSKILFIWTLIKMERPTKTEVSDMRQFFKRHPWLKCLAYLVSGIVGYKCALEELDNFKSVASSVAFLSVIVFYYFDKFEKHAEEIEFLKEQISQLQNGKEKPSV